MLVTRWRGHKMRNVLLTKMDNSSQIPAFAIAAAFVLTGCASTRIQHLGAKEFIESAEMIEQMNSAMWMTYVGSSQGRAYLEYQDMLTIGDAPKTVLYWTELESLPADLATQLRSGRPPWTPWSEQSESNREQHSGAHSRDDAKSSE